METRAKNARDIKRSFSYFKAFEEKRQRLEAEQATTKAEEVEERKRAENEW